MVDLLCWGPRSTVGTSVSLCWVSVWTTFLTLYLKVFCQRCSGQLLPPQLWFTLSSAMWQKCMHVHKKCMCTRNETKRVKMGIRGVMKMSVFSFKKLLQGPFELWGVSVILCNPCICRPVIYCIAIMVMPVWLHLLNMHYLSAWQSHREKENCCLKMLAQMTVWLRTHTSTVQIYWSKHASMCC